MIDLRHLELLARRLDLRLGRSGGRPEPGARRVAVRGRGLAFAGHREYQPGDDVRSIDWNVTARLGRPYVKVFEQEMAGVVLVALDVSASMRAGPGGRARWRAALEVAALLLLAAAVRDERIGAVAFTDRVERYLPPRRGRRYALRAVHVLDDVRPTSRGTDLAGVLRALDRMLRLSAVVVVVSDFLAADFPSRITPALGRLSVRHDVIGIAVGHRRDGALPARRLVRVEDPETGQMEWIDTASAAVREAWAGRWRQAREAARLGFRAVGAPLLEIEADGPWLSSLMARHLVARSAVGR